MTTSIATWGNVRFLAIAVFLNASVRTQTERDHKGFCMRTSINETQTSLASNMAIITHWYWGLIGLLGFLGVLLNQPLLFIFFVFFIFFIEPRKPQPVIT
jgi:hypothetical protein